MDVDTLVARVHDALSGMAGIRLAYLFGSRVTGRARPDSDLDVAVLYDPGLDAAGACASSSTSSRHSPTPLVRSVSARMSSTLVGRAVPSVSGPSETAGV